MTLEEYKQNVEQYIKDIPKRIYEPVGKLNFDGFFTYERLSFENAKKRERKPLPVGLKWGKKWEYGWFFSDITIPDELKGKKIAFEAKQGESTVFVNGEVYGAFDKQHSHITLTECASGGERFEIAMEVYGGHDGLENTLEQEHTNLVLSAKDLEDFPDDVNQKTIRNATFGIIYDDVFGLWIDLKLLYDLSCELGQNSLRKLMIDKALSQMCNIVDREAEKKEFLKEVQKGREILKPILECKNGSTVPLFYAMGHSHLDLEWLWTKNETRRKAARTLGNQLRLIKEYDGYIYLQSQPWILEVVKNEYPDLYEEIKRLVKSGNIVVEGGTWVEPDVNIPSGESLVRQFIFGKQFIKEEFGVDSEIFWLPDSFGMTAALPQIMKGCGIKYFMNAKIMWQYSGGEPVPKSNFMWKGIDGSEVLTHLTPGYTGKPLPSMINRKWEFNREKADAPIGMMAFGFGDGGGGATREDIALLKRVKNLEGMPKVMSGSPNEFFKALEKCPINEKYTGELYYTAHRATYTAQAKTKLLNRRSEFALRDAEMWSVFSDKNTKRDTDELWKTVLFNQFHDIIPGTSISPVYEDTEKELSNVICQARAISDKSFEKFVDDNDEYITIFNSLPWEREECISLPNDCVALEGCKTEKSGDKTVAFVKIPPCGFKSYKIGGKVTQTAEKGDSLVLENGLVRAEFNQNGELVSVIDKESNTEYLSAPSNVFRMYRNKPAFFDAWDIDGFYEKLEVKTEKNIQVKIGYMGELEKSLLISTKFNNSTIKQKVVLQNNSKRLDFETEIDWQETHKLLKTDFNTNIHSEELVSEIQFGYIKRPNHKTRPYDQDRFEVCEHKWSALCENKRGAAILNDCKYGISADDGRMSLTLLTSSAKPARKADRGIQKFTYSFMLFSESLFDSGVLNSAYEINCPVEIKKGYAGEKSYLSLSEKNVIAETVKYAQDNSGDVILRIYEAQNALTRTNLNFGFDVKEVYETDMLENNLNKLEIEDNTVALEFKPFEIKTLRIKK